MRKKENSKWMKWGFMISILISIVFSIGLTFVQLDYDFEKFFPKETEETSYFFEHRKEFDSDNDFLLIALSNELTLFDYEFLEKVKELVDRLDTLPLVEQVVCLTNQNNYAKAPFGFEVFEIPYIDFEKRDGEKDSVQIFSNKELIGVLIDSSATALNIMVKHESYMSKEKCDKLLKQVKEILKDYSFDSIHTAGRVVGQAFYIDQMKKELTVFFIVSGILVVIFLFIAFRSFQGILFPLIIVLSSMIWVFGFMGVLGEPLNILLTILPTIMFVVSMSDVIHFVSRYIDEQRSGSSTSLALKITIKEVGLATFLTSLTTSIGFFSLLFVEVEPVKEFGLYTGIGVLLAFLATYGMLPFFLLLSNRIDGRKKNKGSGFWDSFLKQSFLNVLRKRKLIVFITLILIVVSFIGLFQIERNHYILDDISDETEVKQDVLFFDQKFGGVRPVEIAVQLKDNSKRFTDLEVLKEVEKLETYLIDFYRVRRVNSIVSLFKFLNRMNHSAIPEYYKLPKSQKEVNQLARKYLSKRKLVPLNQFISENEKVLRVFGSIGDIGSVEVKKRNTALRNFIESEINQELVEVRITGTAHLLDKNMETLSRSIALGLLLAVFIVSMIMAILFKSFRIVLISIVPNLIPLVFIAGIMGFFGIEFKLTTAIIFTIAFGICVDDTIHFLSKFNLELKKGKSLIYALKNTYVSTGKAIILTSLILCSGFLMLIFSDFNGTFYTGLLITISLFFAVIADLTILPILLLSIKKEAE